MIQIRDICIDKNEIAESFIRCSGPGGQNVNKVNSGVQLRFDALHSASLPEDVRKRLIQIAGKRVNKKGEIVLTVQKYRNQHGNRQEAVFRLTEMIEQALKKPVKRKKTKISRAAQQRRLTNKRHRSLTKIWRRKVSDKRGAGASGPSFMQTANHLFFNLTSTYIITSRMPQPAFAK